MKAAKDYPSLVAVVGTGWGLFRPALADFGRGGAKMVIRVQAVAAMKTAPMQA